MVRPRDELGARAFGKAGAINYGFNPTGVDEIHLTAYVSAADGIHFINLALPGKDLLALYENPGVPGEVGQITIQDHILSAKYTIDAISFGPSSNYPVFHVQLLRGDAFTYSLDNGVDVGGEDIVLDTTGNDQIYGGIRSDIILCGVGADQFIYIDDEDNRGGSDIILDFDLTEDILDYTEIKTRNLGDLAIADNSYGNVVISSAHGDIELKGITAAGITIAIFVFF